MKTALLACLSAIAVQLPVFVLWSALPVVLAGESVPWADFAKLASAVVLVAVAHLLVLGIPSFWVLQRAGKATALNVAILGFVVGCIGVALYSWPMRTGGSSFSATWHGNYTELIVNGVPTIAGWLYYLEGVLQFGAHGLVGAMAFIHVWRRPHAASQVSRSK